MRTKLTSIEKWKHSWWVDLSVQGKLMYWYLNERSDLAGFYEIFYKYIQIDIGLTQEEAQEAFKELGARLVFSKDNKIIWLKDHPLEQGNHPLSLKAGYHKTIIRLIAENISRFDEESGLSELEVVSQKGANDHRSIIVEIHANKDLLRYADGMGKVISKSKSISKSNCISNGNGKSDSLQYEGYNMEKGRFKGTNLVTGEIVDTANGDECPF